MTDRMSKKRRLERAGYVYVAGWFADAREAALARLHIEKHREMVERVLDEPPKPRGRPRKPA